MITEVNRGERENEKKTLEIRERLSEAEQTNNRVRLSYGTEEFEEATEAANTEEGELSSRVSESGSESECHLSVHLPLV